MTLWNRYSNRQASSLDENYFFLANRTIRTYLAFISVIASETSVATIIVFPQIGFSGNLNLIWLPLGYIVGRWIVARFILPDIYQYHKVSIYATVSKTKRANKFLSSFYLLSKFLSSGVRIFLASVALSTLLGYSITGWTLFMGAITAVYCLTGGLRAVVWIDQIQGTIIYLAAAIIIAILLLNDQPYTPLLGTVNFTDFNFKIDNLFYSPLLFFGGMVITIGTHGTDQDILQRLLGTRTIRSAQRALIYSGFGVLVLICAYTIIGYLLHVKSGLQLNPEKPLLDFIVQNDQPVWTILFSILVLAASTSTLAPAIHSMGAVWLAIRNHTTKPGVYYSFLALLGTLVFAEISIELKKTAPRFLDLAIGVMNYVLGGKITIFTYFSFFKQKLTTRSIMVALISGFFVTSIANFLLPITPAWPIITLSATFVSMVCTGLNLLHEKKHMID